MRNIFLVTSGIHGPNGRSGSISVEQRIDQTVATAQSIRQRVDNAEIYLLEGGKYPLDLDLRNKFKQYYSDILDYSSSSFVSFAHNNVDLNTQDITVIKGPCETWMLLETVKLINARDPVRIFKISGRYYLNNSFDLEAHHSATNRYLFKDKLDGLPWYGPNTGRIHSPYQYSTRLYSFCGNMLSQVVNNYSTLLNRFMDIYAKNDYIDLEHLTYLTLNPNQISTIPTIGVEGIFANHPDTKAIE